MARIRAWWQRCPDWLKTVLVLVVLYIIVQVGPILLVLVVSLLG